MLSSILSKSKCAECKFCCVFRRQSRWETPLFPKEAAAALSEKYKNAKFRPVGDMFTIDIDGEYKTDDPEEEAPCFFLDSETGCMLSEDEKPVDCKIWPLRIMDKGDKTVIALTPAETVRKLVENGLGKVIEEEAGKNPDMIKEYREGFPVLSELDQQII